MFSIITKGGLLLNDTSLFVPHVSHALSSKLSLMLLPAFTKLKVSDFIDLLVQSQLNFNVCFCKNVTYLTK